jgi:hypothetical protein
MSGRFGNLVLLALAACILCSFPSAVDAHAALLAPMSRNEVCFTSIGSAWTSNAGNGGVGGGLRMGFPGESLFEEHQRKALNLLDVACQQQQLHVDRVHC